MSTKIMFDESRNLQVVDRDEDAAPTGDQVRVRISLAGVNFWEVMQRRGKVPIPPDRVPGSEGVGVVVSVGPDVAGLVPGQRVAWSRASGSFSSELTVPAASLVAVPEGVSDEAAAALLFQGLTAQYLAHETWPLTSGDIAVVTAAAGGVGQLLTQLLVASGAQVIGVASSEAKLAAAHAAGAWQALTYGDALPQQVRDLAPDGVSAVYDAVGAGVAELLLATLRPRGAMVLYGSASGQDAEISAGALGAGSFYLTRTAGRDYLGDADRIRAKSAELLSLVANGYLTPSVGAVYPLTSAGEALDELESRKTVGKILLRP